MLVKSQSFVCTCLNDCTSASQPASDLPKNIVICLITLNYKVANTEDIHWGSLKLILAWACRR